MKILYNIFTTKNQRRLSTMLNNNIVSKFLGICNVNIDDFKETDKNFEIYISTNPISHVCPCCGNHTAYIHDYRLQKIKHSVINGKTIFLMLNKRRYVCPNCHKKFAENYSFLPKYYHSSNVFFYNILLHLKSKSSFKDIAKHFNVSTNTVQRAFKLLNTPYKTTLPTVLGIDEFKGNTGGEKYNLILTDLNNNKLWDILPSRKKTEIISYFRRFPLSERAKVRVFVMDMTNNYCNISWLFPNAQIVVDRYHFIRQVYWALDNVRKRVQKSFPNDKRLHFKHNRRILFKEYSSLNEEQQAVLRRMLDQNEDLYTAWSLKEWFIDIKKIKNPAFAEKELHNWLNSARESNLPEFKACISAFHNWFGYIINSFTHKFTNGFTEGMNNNIKVLKRIAYGYRNFENFRNRILHCFG